MSSRSRRAAPRSSVRLTVEQLEGRDLLSASPLLTIDAIPSDTSFSTQWSLNNTGQNGGTPDADIDAPEAWDVTTGSLKTIVAIIDTGIDYRHKDLHRNIWINQGEIPGAIRARLTDIDSDGLITFWDLNDTRNKGSGKAVDINRNGRIDAYDILRTVSEGGWADRASNDGDSFVDDLIGWDFVNNDNDPLDDNDHGSHVAGIIGATGNNAEGVAGVNWKVQLMAVKTIGANGTGVPSAVVAGLQYAVAHGAGISNNSYGESTYSPEMYAAIDAARAQGHIFVAAAGNGGPNYVGDDLDAYPVYPGSYNLPNVVTVTATNQTDTLPLYANTGKNTVDLGAPGRDILSTTRWDRYKTFSGTSMATPHAAGVLALVRGQHPDWQYFQVIDQVLASVDPISALAGKSVTGGRLNAYRAVSEVRIDAAGARVVSAMPNATGGKPVSSVRLTFSEGIDASSFGVEDAVLVGPNGTAAATQIVPVANSDNRQFDVVFPQQSASGSYTLQVGTGIKDLAGNLLNQDGDGVNGEAGQDGCAASFVIQPILTFTSTTKVSIRDLTKNIATLTIGSDVFIADLNVRIDLRHTFDNDLYIHLIDPDGTDVVLANRRGGTADNYTNTLFDDEATKSISAGTAPFNGTFRPETALSAFDGKNARGTWQLVIEDRQGGDSGTLNSWSLIIENGTAPSAQTNPPGSATLNTFRIEEAGQGANERTGSAPAAAIEGPLMLPAGERVGETVQPVETHGEQLDVRSLEARIVDLAFTRVQSSTLAWGSVRQDAPPTLDELVEFFKRFARR